TGERAGRGGGRGSGNAPADTRAGLFTARFEDGSTIQFWVGDPGTGEAKPIWHNQADDRAFTAITAIDWPADSPTFPHEPEEWTRWYRVAVSGDTPTPVELTPGDGQVEHTSISKDGKTLFYTTNYLDRDRRHVWRVPTSGGKAEQVTTGDGIETYPAALA